MVLICEVKTKRQNRLFITFPDRLYKDTSCYVPGFKRDEFSDYSKKKNPAFSYCTLKRFLAYKDGKLVGRIGAILSQRANQKWGENRMRFTAVDFIDDQEVSAALFAAVEDFARENGCDGVHGPLGFTDLDREGMLVDGFDQEGLFYTYYNAPYYAAHMEKLGYQKEVDWLEYKIVRPADASKQMDMLHRISTRAVRKYGIRIAPVKKRSDYKPYIAEAFRLLNLSYRELYGTVDLDEAQVSRYIGKFLPMILPDYACVVLDAEGSVIGFGATAPCLSATFRETKGKLFPFGFIKVLRAMKKAKGLELFLIAVHPDWQGKGVNAMIIDYVFSNAWRAGMEYAETGPQLENNANVISQWQIFPTHQHKRRRCYAKALAKDAEEKGAPPTPHA